MVYQATALSLRTPTLYWLPNLREGLIRCLATTRPQSCLARLRAASTLGKVWAAAGVASISRSSSEDHNTILSAAEARTVGAEAARCGRILVVEDEGIVALDIKMTLRRLGHQVLATVDTGDEAILQAINQKPDLILMDIRLKGETDGIEAAHQILAIASIPVVYLTGQLDEGTVRRAKSTNPAGYLAKPFTAPELSTLIQQILERCQDCQ